MKNICVFLSSSETVSPAFFAEAETLGSALASAGYGVVYGGSRTGPMTALAKGVHDKGGHLIGVVPEMDFVKDVVEENLSEKLLVPTMAERKRLMLEHSDGFVVFPGGLGTLDELTEILCLKQIDVHQKPVVFYNIFNFWTPFLEALDFFIQQRMITTPTPELFTVFDTPQDVIEYLHSCLLN